MPRKNKKGPSKYSRGPRDGRGVGKGRNRTNGIGKKTGGKKGKC